MAAILSSGRWVNPLSQRRYDASVLYAHQGLRTMDLPFQAATYLQLDKLDTGLKLMGISQIKNYPPLRKRIENFVWHKRHFL